jgi:hypothetical protein
MLYIITISEESVELNNRMGRIGLQPVLSFLAKAENPGKNASLSAMGKKMKMRGIT